MNTNKTAIFAAIALAYAAASHATYNDPTPTPAPVTASANAGAVAGAAALSGSLSASQATGGNSTATGGTAMGGMSNATAGAGTASVTGSTTRAIALGWSPSQAPNGAPANAPTFPCVSFATIERIAALRQLDPALADDLAQRTFYYPVALGHESSSALHILSFSFGSDSAKPAITQGEAIPLPLCPEQPAPVVQQVTPPAPPAVIVSTPPPAPKPTAPRKRAKPRACGA